MSKQKSSEETRSLRSAEAVVRLKYNIEPEGLGGFHTDICTSIIAGKKVKVSGGFGCGHSMVYVSVDGHRVIECDSGPFLASLIDEALRMVNNKEA